MASVEQGLALERQLLSKVEAQLRQHTHDVTSLEGYLASAHAAYDGFFSTLAAALQTHQTLLRKVDRRHL